MKLFSGLTKKFKKKAFRLEAVNRVHKDWFRSLAIFFFLIFASAVVGVYMFLDADNIEIDASAGSVQATGNVIDQELLEETIEFYRAKKERFDNLQNNYQGAPSI